MTKYEGSTTTTTVIFRYFPILQDLEYSYLALEHPVVITVGAFPPKISLVPNWQVWSQIDLWPPGQLGTPRHGPCGVRGQARRPARVVWRAGGPVAASIRLSEPRRAARGKNKWQNSQIGRR